MRKTVHLLAALALTACGDSSSGSDPEPDAQPMPDMAAPDMAPPDAEVPDAAIPDQGLVILDAPEGRVYAHDPITDEGELTRVTLTAVTDPEGHLTSEWVQVFNCLNEEGGLSADVEFGPFEVTVSLCHEVQTLTPDPDGHYLSVQPPDGDIDSGDQFAELMMYHHVNLAHDFFKDVLGFADLDFPLPALVNVQFKLDPPVPLPGLDTTEDGWVLFANAAFFPRESWELFAEQFGLPPRDSDTIIFGQGTHDFSYDALVIYHEYTHAVIGTGRLQAPAVADALGLDASSRAMNEGLADYFAATLADQSAVGVFGIGSLRPELVRDLSVAYRCPDDLLDEVHADGRIIGSALWAVRERLGAEVTDALVYAALEQFTPNTTHQQAAQLLVAEAEAADIEGEVRPILEDHGLLNCVRSRAWSEWRAAESRDGLPHRVEGTQTVGLPGFADRVPAYKQFYIDTPETVQAVTLSWVQQPQGGLVPGQGGEVAPLELALRSSQPVVVEPGEALGVTADQRVTPPLEDDRQTVSLSRGCLNPGGRTHTLFLNPGESGSAIVEMQVEIHEVIEGDLPNLELCGDEPPEPPMADAGLPDAGLPDAGLADAGLQDAGQPDAEAPDADLPDAGPLSDAGP